MKSKLVMIQDKSSCRLVHVTSSGGEIVEQTFEGRVAMKQWSKNFARKWNIPLYNRKLNGIDVL